MKTLLLNEVAPKNALAANQPKRKNKLTVLFHRFPELMEAYCAVQDFHILRNEPTPVHKRASLVDWISKYSSSSVPEVSLLAKRIHHWRIEIYNTWQFGKSNSPAEGLNNNIKVLKRVAYGHHDFELESLLPILCMMLAFMLLFPYVLRIILNIFARFTFKMPSNPVIARLSAF